MNLTQHTNTMTTKDKVITLTVVTIVSVTAIAFVTTLAWTLSIIFGH